MELLPSSFLVGIWLENRIGIGFFKLIVLYSFVLVILSLSLKCSIGCSRIESVSAIGICSRLMFSAVSL